MAQEIRGGRTMDRPKYYKGGGDGEIDDELRKLLDAMNEVGLVTMQSCSGHGEESAYISIDMACIEDIAIREAGRKLVIWWNRPEKG